MENIQEIQDKIFFEAKNALESLSKITSIDELLAKQDLFSEVTDRIAFLRILEKNIDFLTVEETMQIIDNQELNLNFDNEPAVKMEEIPDDYSSDEHEMEEEVLFTNELNEIDEVGYQTEPISEVGIEENLNEEFQTIQNEDQVVTEESDSSTYASRVAQKEQEFNELEERRRKIVEFNKEDVAHEQKEEVLHENKSGEHHHAEKKFKLANIKGLKAVQSLFDEDPLEKFNEEESKNEVQKESGSLLKTNVSTDFMEAEKKKPEFKLDLNDKVAFTKILFKGDDEKLKTTIEKLNSFDNLEEARHYLSDIYYENDWSKADEYAQRLWHLVENKFL
ncbi:hypothetical protein [Chryseobacterium sp. R2A-55]|uniref:hypothetical protein n=1 Tax=Chryseobacterium sp. R2A-55 TaxID=2744445 RepID=UPI001F273DF0|nr:hypothetical protein [Chryseobacterium sp. R2A-55]